MKYKSVLIPFALITLAIFFTIKGLVLAKEFLVPLTIAVLLALICTPLARRFQKWGFSEVMAAVSCVLVCVLSYLAFFAVIAVQVGKITQRWPEMEQEVTPKIRDVIDALEDKTGLQIDRQLPEWLRGAYSTDEMPSPEEAKAELESNEDVQSRTSQQEDDSNSPEGEENPPVPDGVKKQLGQIVVNIFGFIGSSVLLFVYLFFLLYFRRKVKLSILRFFKVEERERVNDVLEQSSELARNFLGGRLLLVGVLAVLYTIGLYIAGVENAILISVIAAMLNLIPYVGSIAGYLLALALGIFGGGDMGSLIIISLTFAIAQFLDNNILEPFVVGDKVNLNPLATIILVVLGGSIWGVAGMILSIPVAGIFKIVFDSTRNLEPLGYMLGVEDSSDGEPNFLNRWGDSIRGLFKKKQPDVEEMK
jgi:predicted PurR-regulated permease PerM